MGSQSYRLHWSNRVLLRSALLAIGMFMVLLGITALISGRTQKAELHEIETAFVGKADLAYYLVQDSLGAQMRGLDVVRQYAAAGLLAADATFDVTAAAIMETTGPFAAVVLMDPEGRVLRAWHPWEGRTVANRLMDIQPELADLMQLAALTGEPQLSEELELVPDQRSIAAFFPILRSGIHHGFVAGVIKLDSLDAMIERLTGSQLSTRLMVGRQVFAPVRAAAPTGQRLHAITLYNRFLVLQTEWPLQTTLRPRARTDLYWGLALSLLSGVFLFGLQLILQRGNRASVMLSGVLQTVPAAVISLDSTRRISVVNNAAEQMFRRPAADMIGQDLDILLPPEARERHRQHLDAYAASDENVRVMRDWRTVYGQRADGEQFPVLVTIGKSQLDGQPFHLAVLRDMTEEARAKDQLTALLGELRKQKDAADLANQAKTMFLASMSHELRTPLNAIIGFSDILQAEMFGPIGNERYSGYIDDIGSSGRHLLKLIGDILDQAKIEIGAYQFESQDIDLAATVRSAVQVMSPMIADKGLAIHMAGLDQPVAAWADMRAAKQVFLNLLANAVKFTEPGGSISVALAVVPGDASVRCEINDTGCGMTPEDLQRVGMPFVQVGNPYRAEIKGTGLGLAISKQLVQGMAGELRLESQYGIGTRVAVTLPAVAPG